MYLVDSSVLIDFLKNKEYAIQLLKGLKPYERGTSTICIGEILEGLSLKKEKDKFTKLVSLITIYNVDLKTAVKFAEIRKELRKTGNLIDNFDLLIAATCLANDLTLITNNLKHFERIGGLKILDIKKPSN